MQRVIYIDVLFCINLIIDFLLLLSVKKYLSSSVRYRRLFLGSVVGGLSSFVILLPPLNEFLSIVLRLATAAAVVFATFFPTSKKNFIKAVCCYFLMTFCLCGAAIAVWMIFAPKGIAIRNGAVYFDISPLVLIVTISACYLIVRIICRVTGRSEAKKLYRKIKISNNGKTVQLLGKVDSGHNLKEPFSGECVIVAAAESVSEALPKGFPVTSKNMNLFDVQNSGFRLVPYSSVGGDGVLMSFKPQEVSLCDKKHEEKVSAYIAVCPKERISQNFDALIPLELISHGG